MTPQDLPSTLQPMLVRHWMQPSPMTIDSDTLVSEAKRLISENNLHALPVVDGARLRGLVTRANLLRMGHFVLRTQNPDEFNFFVTRLKVKDIMVRNPATVQASDTMEHCMALGQEMGVAQFPVLDGKELVGVISANEIFQLAAHCVSLRQQRNPAPPSLRLASGKLPDPAPLNSAVVHVMRPVVASEACGDSGGYETELVLRFSTRDTAAVLTALAAAGFPVARIARPVPPVAA
jgi:acetoin utilization protein AcuB